MNQRQRATSERSQCLPKKGVLPTQTRQYTFQFKLHLSLMTLVKKTRRNLQFNLLATNKTLNETLTSTLHQSKKQDGGSVNFLSG